MDSNTSSTQSLCCFPAALVLEVVFRGGVSGTGTVWLVVATACQVVFLALGALDKLPHYCFHRQEGM